MCAEVYYELAEAVAHTVQSHSTTTIHKSPPAEKQFKIQKNIFTSEKESQLCLRIPWEVDART